MLWKRSFRTTVLHLLRHMASGRDPICLSPDLEQREPEESPPAARRGHLHDAARLAPLGRVLHQIPYRTVEVLGVAYDGGGLGAVLEAQLREARRRALDHILRHRLELELAQVQVAL